ncbi:DUF1553 domain-containing protein [uncultured Paludibaculum sp.]|uniref:DUF1553 domain-containing protein n=1 Tax=uncultured Paludibaculum sp. TaxID=1765020 RepID=UPI002AAC4689|nr:DUF1553 domain-containing protein [uncultured Paludibaculum sp.]
MRAIWIIAVLPGVLFAGSAKPVDFDREVRPILSDKCFKCHGPDEQTRKAGLRFDDRESAFGKGVITPGNSAESKLYKRVSHEKKGMRMPPPTSGMTLNENEIALIKRWIDEGAKWETHWAYQAPKHPTPPVTKRKNWARNPIDSFLLAKLESEGLPPSPEAARSTLIRRVTFDLTGLPPTPAEVAAFLKDKSPDAYEKVVDRLLASPRYGERMAMQWLDLARYADTHGYHIDSHRDMWPWRDWVISAFNRNLPFDQFTLWQLAGDLLPNATREQRVATGFNRNHMINFEGGAIPEEYQAEYVADRVETTSNVWMGTTLGCAKCHDHKYDPIRQKDFYRFGAFFNTLNEKGLDGQKGNAEPLLELPDETQGRQLAELKQTLQARMDQLPPEDLMVAQWAWEKASFDNANPVSPTEGLRAWYELDGNLTDISGHFRNGRVLKGDIVYAGGGPVNRAADIDASTQIRWPAGVLEPGKPFTLAFWFRIGRQKESKMFQQLEGQKGFEVGFGSPETLPRLRRGHHLEVRWFDGPAKEYQVRSDEWIEQGRLYHAAVVSDGKQVSLFLDGEPTKLIVEKQTLPGPVEVDGPIDLNNTATGCFFRGRLDDLRVYGQALRPEQAEQLALEYPAQVLLATPGKRSRDQYSRLRQYYLTKVAPADWRGAYAEFKKLSEQKELLEEQIPTTMVMAEAAKPRDTYLLGRGDYTNKVEKVTPGVPAMLPPLPAGAKADRLALAQWLVNPNHPLTARVAVNRYWQMYFGTGIVKTSEDFGSQGEPPVHPELLDWLATEFIRTGWDVKGMQRLIVTSAAYRQSSKVTPALHEKDPENRLLARGPRFRLQAEMIRDNALAVSGLLKEKVGGPSVLPYQPAGLWEELAFGEAFSAQEYKQDHGDKLYRRSMYTFWKRTVPPASLNTFDAPDREKCTARRAVTNTPLQALVTLNDPTYVEAARNLAQELLGKPETDDQRLRDAFQQVTARPPSKEELQVLRASLRGEMATYKQNKANAEDLLKIGESAVNRKVEPATLAAWTNLCTVLLNLDETITKE